MLSDKAKQITPSPTLSINAKAKELKNQGINVISFSQGEPDFNTPDHIKKAAITAIEDNFTRYTPASGMIELKQAISEKFLRDNDLSYDPNQIIISNGAKHALLNVMTAILNIGDEVLIPTPYWVSYPELVKLVDGCPVPVKASASNNFKVTPEDLKKYLSSKTRAIIINTPTNPTGQIYSQKELEKIGEFALNNGLYIISDEVYEYMSYNGQQHISIASLSEELKQQTVVLNGVSKSYAMTGWRIGYSAAPKELAHGMSAIQSHGTSNPSSISQKGALAAIRGPQNCVNEMVAQLDERRKFMYERLSQIPGFQALEPVGSFYLFASVRELIGKSLDEKIIRDSHDFAELLLDKESVTVVPGNGFGSPDHIRMTFAMPIEEISLGLDRIEEFITKFKLAA
ncbi:pyridoxal phosphate-dependent aminotransferase [Natranaerobius thermophilus]|uniref:Aminotransferase n=1 Tax=Natranaerobius thermophilus (strain ATCC BAA-1301 / DSM 18059 / JW/NM-WN-LF) TaxID=457570 RepID=B2A5Z9_NATTJ|nr:pyridoxal phosphate-dependent aminotransferase [Natranaerobius thermophilus]ACB85416.1 L-aspartate aminotransferase [Natranaerobius thermophilus JW/NM-WN-LF]